MTTVEVTNWTRGPVAVTGAAGFVGTNLVKALRHASLPVRAIVSRTTHVAKMREFGCEVALGDVRDRRSLEEALAGCAAVVHLVAIIREVGDATYDTVNRQGAANVGGAALAQRVNRMIHISALGAGPEATRYLRSKWAGEEEVRRSGIGYVILRPSFIIGPGGGSAALFADVTALGMWYPLALLLGWKRGFARLADLMPIVPVLGSGQVKFMPVDIRDLSAAVRQALERDDVLGQTYELGGPDLLTYDAMIDTVARELRMRRWKIHVPLAISRAMVALFSVMPHPPITRDEFESLLVDNVCDNSKVVQSFGLSLRPFVTALHDALAAGGTA